MLISIILVIGFNYFCFVKQRVYGQRCPLRTDFEVSHRFLVYISSQILIVLLKGSVEKHLI